MITAPGIYPDMSPADYFADPCPEPSLTQSIAKVLIERSPLHAWHEHPRLNPDFVADEETKFDLGNTAHALLLGRGKNVARIEFADWRTKAAKEAREKYAELGMIAVLAEQYDRAEAMVEAARIQLARHGIFEAFKHGRAECVLAWQDEGMWCRTMIDCLAGETFVFDYKTTARSCAPHEMPDRASTEGWDVQAAFHERGLDALLPDTAGRRGHFFIAQEVDPPHQLSVVRIGNADLTLGRKKIDYAMAVWRDCMKRRVWPGYPAETIMSEPRAYLETKWLDREIEHDEKRRASGRDAKNLLAG